MSEFQHQFEWQGGLVTGAEWEGERGQGRPLKGAHRLLFFFFFCLTVRYAVS